MGNELLDESLCDIIAEKRRSAEQIRNNLSTVPVRQWDQQAEIKSLEDEADRLDRARMKMEIEMANLRKENAKLREALEMVRDAHYTKEADGELYEGFEVEADDGTGRPLICIVEDALAATEGGNDGR